MKKLILIAFTALLVLNGCKPDPVPAKPSYDTQKVIDSVNTIWRKGAILSLQHEIDSLKKSAKTSQNIVTPLKKTVKYQQFQIDSMRKAKADCPEILAKATETIDTMNVVIDELGKEAESYSKALYNCEQQRTLDSAILSDSKALNKQSDSLLHQEYKNTAKAQKQTKSAVFWGNVKATVVAIAGLVALVALR